MRMIRNVIFDLDGTLADTGPGILESAAYTIRTMGLQEPGSDALRRFIGPPLKESFAAYCGCTEQEAQRAVAVFRAYYQAGAVFHAEPYPGIPALCALLKRHGFRLGVATNKPQRFADALLHHLGLAGFFDAVCGADERGELTKSGLILLAAERMNAALPETVMIGDTENDAAGAGQAGVTFLAVTYGYGFRDAAACAAAAQTPAQIAEILLPCDTGAAPEWSDI